MKGKGKTTSKVFPRTESGGKGPKADGVEYYNDDDNAYGDNNTIMMTMATLMAMMKFESRARGPNGKGRSKATYNSNLGPVVRTKNVAQKQHKIRIQGPWSERKGPRKNNITVESKARGPNAKGRPRVTYNSKPEKRKGGNT